MQILSVALKDFKSHSDRYFEFQLGTNTICGENGAGKTSILEAIAWVLFNYTDYSKEELIRRGATSAQVTVRFISKQEGRTYQIQRCTQKGYEIYDPQIKQKLDLVRVDDVTRWLREHLGLPKNIKLSKLFADTIGIPQGTFTADFLKTPEDRKKVFDPILKVEEYKQAFEKASNLKRYAEVQVEEVKRQMGLYDQSLADWEGYQQQAATLRQEIAQAEAKLLQYQAELVQLQTQKDQLTLQAAQIQQLTGQIDKLGAQITGKQQTHQLLHQSLQKSQAAIALCEANQPSYQAFLQVEATLQELDSRSQQQQALLKQREGYQKQSDCSATELTKLMVQLEALAKAEAEIVLLQPLLQQQGELEQQQAQLTEQLQHLLKQSLEFQNTQKQQTSLQAELHKLAQEIQRVAGLETVVSQIPELEQQRDRYQEQLSRIEAATQFETDLRQLLSQGQTERENYLAQANLALVGLRELQQTVPLLSASVDLALNTIQAGVDLNDHLLTQLQEILADLTGQTSVKKLKQQLQQIKQDLEIAYRQRMEFTSLETLRSQQAQKTDQLQQVQAQLAQLQTQLRAEPTLQAQKAQLVAALQGLDNPRGRQQLLARDLQQQPRIQAQYNQVQQSHTNLQQQILGLDTQLREFEGLAEQIEQQKQLKRVHQPGYLTYLQQEAEAKRFPTLEQEVQQAIAQLQVLETQQISLKAELEACTQAFDPQHLQSIEQAYYTLKTQNDQLAGGLPQQRKFLTQLEKQLADLAAIAEKRTQAEADLSQRQQVLQFILDARQVYNQAGPRITKFYLTEISREADRLFRELLNRQSVALEWTGDYEIRIQEEGYWRGFKSLSGGEQMCAALAVRLALLKVLADMDLAFFDEPTTNMDQPRRRQLAEAIANLKTFRQLFIISHDDTFENVTENIIRVEREVKIMAS